MKISTPHVYVSALLWISKKFFVAKECSPSIRRSQLVMQDDSHDSVDVAFGPYSEFAKSVGLRSLMASSPDGSMIATRQSNRSLRTWDTRNGKCITKNVEGKEGLTMDFAFSPDSSRIVIGSADGTLRIWDARTGSLVVGPLEGHTDAAQSVAYSPDGQKIASGSRKTIRIWDSQSGRPLGKPFTGHTGWVCCVAFSPDGRRLVSGSFDRDRKSVV